jgi:hypothetical protein
MRAKGVEYVAVKRDNMIRSGMRGLTTESYQG